MPSKASGDPLVLAGLEYISRCRPYRIESLLLDARVNSLDPEKRKSVEGELLLKKTERSFRIALSENGKHFATAQFAAFMEQIERKGLPISFLIGGAFGHSAEVLEKSDASLSLSAMTMPHRMAFLVLSEQLYRVSELKRGSPYHK